MPLTREPDKAREFTGDLLGSSSDEPGSHHMKLSARQRELNNLWSYFRVCEHDGKGHEWDGRPVLAGEMWDAVQKEGVVPPGMESAGDVPRDLRRPVAPLGIVRNIVSRFTGLLFSNRKQPKVLVPDDERTEDYLGAILKQGQFWAAMTQARNYGGATGSACVGFKITNGRCMFEALDPRWTEPEFSERGSNNLERLTIQYTYPKEEKQPNGRYKKVWYWYRRVIDRETDTTWKPIKCRQNEPRWDYMQRSSVPHGLGFVPYEWIQNLRSDDEIDGDSDCHGAYRMLEAVDQLVAEVWYGTVSNCDPTLTISSGTQDNPGSVKKGSDNALFMGADSSAAYLELAGSGPQTGLTVLEKLEDRIYRLCQCVPDQVLFQNNGEKTAMEIERIFSSMIERADSLREQYGPAIIRLCEMVLEAVRTVEGIRVVEGEDGQPRKIRYRVYVSPRVVQQADGDQVTIPRVIGNGKVCDLQWPPYFKPSPTDIETAQRIATTGKDSEVFTKESAIKYWMTAAGLDPLKEIHALKKAEESAAMAAAPAEGEEGASGGEEEAPEGAEGPDAMTWKEALAQGICTINEYREGALQLGAIPDGDLTLVQYRAKHQDIWVSNTAAQSQEMVKAMVAASQPKPELDTSQSRGRVPGGRPPPQSAGRYQNGNSGKKQASAPRAQPSKAGTSPSSSKPGSSPARPNNAPAKKPSGQTPSKQTKSISASKPESPKPLPLLKPTSSQKPPA